MIETRIKRVGVWYYPQMFKLWYWKNLPCKVHNDGDTQYSTHELSHAKSVIDTYLESQATREHVEVEIIEWPETKGVSPSGGYQPTIRPAFSEPQKWTIKDDIMGSDE